MIHDDQRCSPPQVKLVEVPQHRETREPRGFAFVEFGDVQVGRWAGGPVGTWGCLGMSGDGDAGDLWGFGELVPGGFWGDFWDDFFWDSWDFMMEYIRFVGFMGGFMIYGGLWGFIRCFFFVMGFEATYVTVDNGRLMIPTDFGSNKLT